MNDDNRLRGAGNLGPLPTPQPPRKRGVAARVGRFLVRYGWELRVLLALAVLIGVAAML